MNPHNIHRNLRRFAKSRLALSTVVTTLIVLVVAVLLAGVVTYFAINVTSTRVQEESLVLAKQHIWFDATSSTSQAAIMVINTGGRDVVVDRLTVRGQECAWSKVFYNTTSNSIASDLFSNSTLIDGGSISIGGTNYVFKQASSDLTVQSGKTLIVYLSNPDSISVNDIGLTVSVNIFTSQAMYYKETNVQGTSGTTSTSSTSTIDILYAAAWTPVGMEPSQAALIVKNTGSSTISFINHNIRVKGQISNSYIFGAVGNFVATNELPYDTSGEIQGYTMGRLDTVSIPAGYTAILYITASAVLESDLDQSITLAIVLDDGQTDSIQVTVQAGT